MIGSARRVMLRVLLLLVLVYAGLLLLLWWQQERIVFQPPAFARGEAVTARRVAYRAADGVELFGYLVGAAAAASRVVVAFHGNADLARWLVPWAEELHRRTGAAVFLAEYRGYDECRGRPTYEGSAADARAAVAALRDSLDVPASRLVYYGHSLGTAIATELAVESPPRSLVLESPFTSARAMSGRLAVPGVPLVFPLVARVRFDTERRVRTVASPVWVAHGDRDLVVPLAMGRAVFAAAARKGELLVVPGAGHNDVAAVGGERYWEWLGRAVADE